MAKQTEHATPFSAAELSKLERDYPKGLTTFQIIGLFAKRNIKLTEAMLRKYVQLGLLPQSRRVSRDGTNKHRGTQGLYPAYIVRLILQILELSSSGLTLEEITPTMRNAVALAALDASMAALLTDLPDDFRAQWRELRARLEPTNPLPAGS